VAGRFSPAATVGLRPVFRLDTTLPAPRYRADPSALALGLDAAGAALVLLGLAAGAVELARWRARRRTVEVTPPLVRALTLLREAARRDADDRRRAASLVARTLPAQTDGLASTAAALAWSPGEPAPGELEDLARAVEKELREVR
jgi:hypothetical protein